MLGELLESARIRATELRQHRTRLERGIASAPARPGFAAALRRKDVAVIAEIKRSSPSQGILRPGIDAADQATAFAEGGAAAVSVLTEPTRFSGSLEDLESASATVDIPLLRKDFIVSEEQILEARIAGASAVLLIVRALDPALLRRLAAFAHDTGLEGLVEVRTAAELTLALEIGGLLIGVNARDLETLAVDEGAAHALIAEVPAKCLCVAESGVRDRTDVERAADAGADAVLVGSALSIASDPRRAVNALTGVTRRARADRG